MKVLIGVDPHKVSVAAIDEAKGELLERASFSQDLEKARGASSALRETFPRAPLYAVENAGGLRVGTWR